ncbi:hypothetical protein BDV95DRAFT_503814 [Massariosphaeria phaeospora]|uniref:Bys1 family protein n=1 Tax=Massariosphaeria phaeospora TaxID=100035 RepID=A0A7C8M2U7_9PLEO|nr:hypothetical protein BDV95DRAFT_503814 [Massariosphaeria phaeospora]
MYMPTLLTTLALAASTLAESTIVKNHCDFPVWVTQVTSQGQGATVQIAASSGKWSEPQAGAGVAIKITTTADGLYTAAPVLHLSYSSSASSIYYDLNSIYGYSFSGKTLRLHGSEAAAPEVVWSEEPIAPPNTKAYIGQTNLVLELCE